MKEKMKAWLEENFADRVRLDKTERLMYSHDIASIPKLVKLPLGSTIPDAVVQPETEEELVNLVKWARHHRVPLTPRGKATSGYGGVIPIKKGIVIDFHRIKKLISMDKENLTATVQPGITWEKFDKLLQKDGLTLRLYPTSYPSSSVGGWLAHGGAGLGSYEYGYFPDNVVSARVVLPSGGVRVFTGPELSLIADMEGTTGLISEITLRIMPLEDMDIVSIGCTDVHDVQQMIESIHETDMPIWSMMFINPRMAEMKNRAPLREHWGHPVEERVILPAAYIMTLTFRKKDSDTVKPHLEAIARKCQAEILSDRIAFHEWENRFNLMVVKRLGPSLVPAEVVIPLKNLGDMMTEVERKVDHPVVKEGVLIREGKNGEPEVVILGFIPSDQRKFSYNFVFSLSLTIMKIAEKYGGRAYATGLYFTSKAKDILGADRVEKVKLFKKREDPAGVLNPGKVIGNGVLSMAVKAGGLFEPLVRPFSNHVITQVGERPNEPVKNIPPDVAWYAYSCSQCGYCTEECTQFSGRGWESQSPRGKWFWLKEYMEGRVEWSQELVDTFLVCTTCEFCDNLCSVSLPIEPSWMKLRGKLIEEEKKMTFPPFEMMAAALNDQGNIWAGYRKNRTEWFPEDLKNEHGASHKAKIVYFAGCTASYVEHDIGQAAVRLLHDAGVDFTYLGEKENCCATPMLVAGKWELFVETMKKNIAAVKAAGGDTVVSSCPACDMMWRTVYPGWCEKLGLEYGITAKHYSEPLSEKLKSGELVIPDNGEPPVKVTLHDSCHMGRASNIYDPPRELIESVPNTELVEMEHSREKALCCGSVLTLIKEPEVAAKIGDFKVKEAEDAEADKILALCPCCQFQLRVSVDANDKDMEVEDLARFVASRFGYDFPDPNPEVKAQWAVFDGMIKLMTPEGFATLMGTMWPELIAAMPFGMGPMMKVMGKIPGALQLMKPMFPILFPRLLPMMMPKVMPAMLERVEEAVPMPDYMREQMPDMMPKVMDNLMPHMIDDVVPLVTQPMIDHLQGKA